MMDYLNVNQKDFIVNNFTTYELMESFCRDYLQYVEDMKLEAPIHVDLTPYTTNGVTTGILLSDGMEGEILSFTMLIDGAYRKLNVNVNDSCLDSLIPLAHEILDPEYHAKPMTDEFEFLNRKSFKVQTKDGTITFIQPLDFRLYKGAFQLYEKILKHEINL